MRSIGSDVEVRLYRPLDGDKEYDGILKAFDDNSITLEQENGEHITIPRELIALVRLAFDF